MISSLSAAVSLAGTSPRTIPQIRHYAAHSALSMLGTAVGSGCRVHLWAAGSCADRATSRAGCREQAAEVRRSCDGRHRDEAGQARGGQVGAGRAVVRPGKRRQCGGLPGNGAWVAAACPVKRPALGSNQVDGQIKEKAANAKSEFRREQVHILHSAILAMQHGQSGPFAEACWPAF